MSRQGQEAIKSSVRDNVGQAGREDDLGRRKTGGYHIKCKGLQRAFMETLL